MTVSKGIPAKMLAAALLAAGCAVRAAGSNPPPASTYYVSTNGNDSFSGTLAVTNFSKTDGPFLTLQRAQQAVEAALGDATGQITVEVRGGTYFLTAPLNFTYLDAGTNSQQVVWEGYPGDSLPLISGGQRLTGWKNAGGNLWTLQLPASFQNFEAFFINGVRVARPSVSNTYLTLNPVVLPEPATNCTEPYGTGYRCGDRFSFTPGDLPGKFHDINDVEVVDFEYWTVSRMRLQSIDTVNSIAYITGLMNTGQYYGFLNGDRYVVQNAKEYFGQPGQWYLDRGTTPWTLSYEAAGPSENPNNETVIVPQQPQLLVAHSLQYVTFQNLAFAHDDFTVPAQGHPGNSGETIAPAALSFNYCSNVTLSGVQIAHTQGWGVEFLGTAVGGAGNTVTGSILYDLGTGGARLGQLPGPSGSDATVAQYNTVSDSMVFGSGRFLPGGENTGIWIGSSHHNTITHNDIHDVYTGAIELGQSPEGGVTYTHDNLIGYNLLYNLGQGVTSDMACVHAASSNNVGNQIVNNVCHDVTNSPLGYGGNGIYLDSQSQDITVSNNLVYRVSDTALFVNTNALGHVISNNIFAYAAQGMIRRGPTVPGGSFTATHNIFLYDLAAIQRVPGDWTCSGNCSSAFSLDYNLYWNVTGSAASFLTTVAGDTSEIAGTYGLSQWASEFGEDGHSQNANPDFVDASYPSDNYALMTKSPARALGFQPFSTDTAGPTTSLTPPVTSVPVAFPLQLLNQSTDF